MRIDMFVAKRVEALNLQDRFYVDVHAEAGNGDAPRFVEAVVEEMRRTMSGWEVYYRRVGSMARKRHVLRVLEGATVLVDPERNEAREVAAAALSQLTAQRPVADLWLLIDGKPYDPARQKPSKPVPSDT